MFAHIQKQLDGLVVSTAAFQKKLVFLPQCCWKDLASLYFLVRFWNVLTIWSLVGWLYSQVNRCHSKRKSSNKMHPLLQTLQSVKGSSLMPFIRWSVIKHHINKWNKWEGGVGWKCKHSSSGCGVHVCVCMFNFKRWQSSSKNKQSISNINFSPGFVMSILITVSILKMNTNE